MHLFTDINRKVNSNSFLSSQVVQIARVKVNLCVSAGYTQPQHVSHCTQRLNPHQTIPDGFSDWVRVSFVNKY